MRRLKPVERLLLFAVFALAIGVSMAHAWQIPIACNRPAFHLFSAH